MMRVLVTDTKGEVFDLNTDVYHPANKPIPWILTPGFRARSTAASSAPRAGKGQWYQKWHGRYICRQWALDHGGEAPKQVDLVKVSYAIPTPEEVAKNGPYVPEERMKRTHTIRHVHTTPCSDVTPQRLNSHPRVLTACPCSRTTPSSRGSSSARPCWTSASRARSAASGP